MPKQKLYLTKSQEKRLTAIKGDKNLRATLTAFATAIGSTYTKVHNRWYYLTVTKKKRAALNSSAVKTTESSNIKPYKVEKNVDLSIRTETKERVEKLRVLKPVLLKLAIRKHALPIYKTDITAMREIFKDQDMAGKVFGITAIKDNPKMVRVYRKS